MLDTTVHGFDDNSEDASKPAMPINDHDHRAAMIDHES
jgi:hypothetical protein